MVKKFISGLLKRKGKGDTKEETKEPEEEVPEELPPLAEDVVEKAEEPRKKEKTGESEEIGTVADLEPEKPPEELPSLDLGDEKEEVEKIETLGEEAKEEELPEEIKKAKAAKVKEEEPKEKDTEEKKSEVSKEKIKPEHEIGFFSNVLEHIEKHEGFKEKLLAGDLFSRMANYWELKKHEIKTGSQLSTENKLEGDLKTALDQLKILEQKWQVQKLALEEDIKFLHEREREIQTKVEELKRISNELSLFKNVKPEEYFRMYNGVVLKSLHDLIDALEIIDDETFGHHVNKGKNDFSEWINHVMKDKSFAEKIKNAKAKEEMIEILETEPVVRENLNKDCKKHLPPRKYFNLSNGVVIQSLYQLSDALKAMDDELFDKHVAEEKNDFAIWVKNTLKNEELAERLEKARTKKEMVEILEVFL